MKTAANLKTLFLLFAAFCVFSCRETVTDEEQQERDKVGDVYNPEQQGVDIENRDNQFSTSRNDNVEGQGQETGAPSDTIDNDGDKKAGNVSPNRQ